jgi:daunorubicin resistance ABC transporter ATP-binding subunit
MTLAIEAVGLVKRFSKTLAVDGVDLAVRPGMVLGLLGPNGAGKTTVVRMLATLLRPDAGYARVCGADIVQQADRVRELIGLTGQYAAVDEDLTGFENLLLIGRLLEVPRVEAKRRSAELLERFDLADAAGRSVKTYSGGMRRRLDLAAALVHRPPVLFLDEPTTGLDPQSRARMWDEVRKLRDTGTTVFLTTHYLEEADALCDRIAIIDHGKIVAAGTPDQLKRQVAGDVVTVGTDDESDRVLQLLRGQPFVREATSGDGVVRLYVDRGEAAMPQILRALDAEGIVLASLSLTRPSLDDVFLRQTGRSLRDAA